MKRILTVLAASLLSVAAFADDVGIEKPYVGIDFQAGKFKQSDTPDANLQAVRLRLGSDIWTYLGLEAQVAAGVNRQDITLDNGVEYSVKLHGLYGAFLRPKLSLKDDNATIYGLAGYSFLGFDASARSAPIEAANGSDHGFSYGVGGEVRVYHDLRVSADYIQYTKSYQAISIGLRIPVQ